MYSLVSQRYSILVRGCVDAPLEDLTELSRSPRFLPSVSEEVLHPPREERAEKVVQLASLIVRGRWRLKQKIEARDPIRDDGCGLVYPKLRYIQLQLVPQKGLLEGYGVQH